MSSALWHTRHPIPITSVVAVTPSWGIGQSNMVPWQAAGITLRQDMQYFRASTTNTVDPIRRNIAVMGRRTWESIPEKNRPLRERFNIVLSNTLPEHVLDPDHVSTTPISTLLGEVQVMRSLDQLLDWATEEKIRSKIEKIVIVGGAQLFDETFTHPWFSTVHLTLIDQDFPCDTWLPERMVGGLQRQLEKVKTPPLHSHCEHDINYRIFELGPEGTNTNADTDTTAIRDFNNDDDASKFRR